MVVGSSDGNGASQRAWQLMSLCASVTNAIIPSFERRGRGGQLVGSIVEVQGPKHGRLGGLAVPASTLLRKYPTR